MTGGSLEPLERDLYKVLATDLPHARRLAFGVVLGQAGVTVAAALCAWGIADRRAALSALLGGGIATAGRLGVGRPGFGGGAGAESRPPPGGASPRGGPEPPGGDALVFSGLSRGEGWRP